MAESSPVGTHERQLTGKGSGGHNHPASVSSHLRLASISPAHKKSSSSLRAKNYPSKNYLKDQTFKNVSLQMQRFKLFFDDTNQERAFRQHYFLKSRNNNYKQYLEVESQKMQLTYRLLKFQL